MSDNEKFYDDEIATVLLEVANKLKVRGMSIVATVEYGIGERASTYQLVDGHGLEMDMLYMMSRAGNNIDGFLISVIRMCNQRGIDLSESMFLRQYATNNREGEGNVE